MALNNIEIAIVKGMIARGDRQHDIAAYFGVNGGRIAEINTGHTGHGVKAATPQDLPPSGPYMAGRSALRARNALLSLRDQIDEAIRDISNYESGEQDADDAA